MSQFQWHPLLAVAILVFQLYTVSVDWSGVPVDGLNLPHGGLTVRYLSTSSRSLMVSLNFVFLRFPLWTCISMHHSAVIPSITHP